MAAAGAGRSSIHLSTSRDQDEAGDQCMQSAVGEGDGEGNDSCAHLEDRDKKKEVLSGASQMLKNGADFPIGPSGWTISSKTSMPRSRPPGSTEQTARSSKQLG